jgi:hypothetical protein
MVLAADLASRKNPSKEKAARNSIAQRVTTGLYPNIFQLNASQPSTSGG